jgi:hypothetical protein
MVAEQELSVRDMTNCTTVAERLIGILSEDVFILMTDEAHLNLSGYGNRQNFRYWAEKIHSNTITGFFTVHM